MATKVTKIIAFVFSFFLFFVPLFFWPTSSELFEFNKMVVTYIATIIIVGLWATRMVIERKFIFRRTIMDIPLIVFVLSQLISTLLSVDPRTSLLGYYSRFNGGFLSTISYSLLYWALVTNLNAREALKAVKALIISGLLVSAYGILEHLGIDKNLWVQDVQNRVFSTLGQPNWLAAFLIALIPMAWSIGVIDKINGKKSFIFWFLASLIFFITFLFTKSRSGILGFAVATTIFTLGALVLSFAQKAHRKLLWPLLIGVNLVFVILGITITTPWRPQFISKLFSSQAVNSVSPQAIGPALETGGTESGIIRKIVWKGAIDIWRHYPVFGSGVETFAFSYYNFRPAEHNLVSEWDFLYNKAHNEYLNYLATTGTVGFLAYLGLIVTFIVFSLTKYFQGRKTENYRIYLLVGFLAGYISILVTNFFGFSVVPVSVLTFIIPGLTIVFLDSKEDLPSKENSQKLTREQLVGLVAIVILGIIGLRAVGRYWKADNFFAKAKNLNATTGDLVSAQEALFKATALSPKEAIFESELAENSADIAIALAGQDKPNQAKEFATRATQESNLALSLSSQNLSVLRQRAAIFIKLSQYDPQAILIARQTLEKTAALAPTDAKIIYNLGLVYVRTNEPDKALLELKRAVELKSNYREARLSLGSLYAQLGKTEEARAQFNYLLKNNPNDTLAKSELQKLK